MTLLEIFLLLLIVSSIVLIIYLISSLKKIVSTLNQFQKDFNETLEKLLPILDNLSVITEKTANITNQTERAFGNASETIQIIRNTFDKLSLKNFIKSDKNPVHALINNLSAFSKGLSAFWSKLNN